MRSCPVWISSEPLRDILAGERDLHDPYSARGAWIAPAGNVLRKENTEDTHEEAPSAVRSSGGACGSGCGDRPRVASPPPRAREAVRYRDELRRRHRQRDRNADERQARRRHVQRDGHDGLVEVDEPGVRPLARRHAGSVVRAGMERRFTRALATAVVAPACVGGGVALAAAAPSKAHVTKAPAKHARTKTVHHCPNMANTGSTS